MPEIHYRIGDATDPFKKPTMICHVCNDIGSFGKGFVVSLSNRYPQTKSEYKKWFSTGKMKLGQVQFVKVSPEITVANMIAQHGIQWEGKIPPIRYGALETCLKEAYAKALTEKMSMAMPRIGCVLAGGDWETISRYVKNFMTVDTYVYTLANQTFKWKDPYEN